MAGRVVFLALAAVALALSSAACGSSGLSGPDRNQAPEILAVTLDPPVVRSGGTAEVRVTARDPDGDPLFFRYAAEAGTITPDADDPTRATYVHAGAPRTSDRITVTVADTALAVAQAVAEVGVQGNRPPTLVVTGGGPCHPPCSVSVEASAEDPDGDALTYAWSGCAQGELRATRCAVSGLGSTAAVVVVQDVHGATTVGTVTAEGVNRPPTVTGGRIFRAVDARFTVTVADPDDDPLTCGWRGSCRCTGTAGGFTLLCSLPAELSSCVMRFACVDPFGASAQTIFQLAP